MKKIVSILIIIFISVNVSSCIEKKVTGKEQEAELTYSINKIPEDLIQDMDLSLSYLLFDGLFIEEEGRIKNSLCSSYYISNENRCYDFSIRKGIVFSGGETINAMDFKVYFDYLKEKGLLSNVKSIKTVDLNTLRIELITEDKYFIKRLADPVFLLRNINDLSSNLYNSYNNIHYSGSYVISYINSNYILLKPNDHYYNKDIVVRGSIKILIQPLDEMALALFDEGKIDILSSFVKTDAGETITLPNTINIIFSDKILKSKEEREGLVFQLMGKLKLSKEEEWTKEAMETKQADLDNTMLYKETINVFYSDENCKLSAEIISEILNANGYKSQITQNESENNQISVCLKSDQDLPNAYPIISKRIYLYNKDVEGYYITSSGILVLIKAYKKLP